MNSWLQRGQQCLWTLFNDPSSHLTVYVDSSILSFFPPFSSHQALECFWQAAFSIRTSAYSRSWARAWQESANLLFHLSQGAFSTFAFYTEPRVESRGAEKMEKNLKWCLKWFGFPCHMKQRDVPSRSPFTHQQVQYPSVTCQGKWQYLMLEGWKVLNRKE